MHAEHLDQRVDAKFHNCFYKRAGVCMLEQSCAKKVNKGREALVAD